jgi:hypothetical protein
MTSWDTDIPRSIFIYVKAGNGHKDNKSIPIWSCSSYTREENFLLILFFLYFIIFYLAEASLYFFQYFLVCVTTSMQYCLQGISRVFVKHLK